MKVGILAVGQVAPEILEGIVDGIVKTFPDTSAGIINDVLSVPQAAFDRKRSQYSSSQILDEIKAYAAQKPDYHRILGVLNIDIFSQGLKYVFGEANVIGKVALISLWRLKPEFYRDKPNLSLYILRAQKEAMHEIGHTLGIQHCPHSLCVMHFSNSIFDTDYKQTLLCDESYLQAAVAINGLG
jgi:archaemetzincin